MVQINYAQATLLAIDTSTPACSVALSHQGKVLVKDEQEARKHTQVLLPMIDELLGEANVTAKDIEGFMISAGPGAFTGLRVGASIAMGMASAYQREIAPLSSLALLAATAGAKHDVDKVIALMDARMSEIYAGLYVRENGLWVNHGKDRVCRPEDLPQEWLAPSILLAGSGLVYKDRIAVIDDSESLLFDEQVYPLAAHLFDFIDSVSWQSAYQGVELHYLRNEVTQS